MLAQWARRHGPGASGHMGHGVVQSASPVASTPARRPFPLSIDPAAPPRHAGRAWDDAMAPNDEVGLLIHRSHLLGADLRVTNFAGGNTSCKVAGVDPVPGEAITQLWIKGSGRDLGTPRREGPAALDDVRLR